MTIAQSPIEFAAPALHSKPAAPDADERATHRLGTYLTLPTQILLAFIVIFPLLMELYISLSSWTPLDGRNWLFAYRYWAGLDNYWELITNARFWQSIGRTLFLMVVCVPIELLLGLGLAVLFHHADADDGGAFGCRLHVLHALSERRAHQRYPRHALRRAGLDRLAEPAESRTRRGDDCRRLAMDPADVPDSARRPAGSAEDQLRMATLLGAGPLWRFRLIVLPRIRAILLIALAIRTIEIFKVFDTLYITAGGPGVSTVTISVYIYKVTMEELNWSYVAAIALVILIALSALAAPAIKRLAPTR
jgi:multiple sugar transport system permease protein